MKSGKISVEQGLYILALGVALGLRIAYLGSAPLSEGEAGIAMKSLAWLGETPSDLGAQPGFAVATGLLFYLFGPQTALARLLPAIMGGLLAGLPYFYRHFLGRKGALILAFSLALDPGLVGLSRQADGSMMAIVLALFAVTAWIGKRPVLTGILAGLCFISGPTALIGALGLGIAYLIARLLHLPPFWLPIDQDESREEYQGSIRSGLISGGTTILLAASFFLIYPRGIGAAADAFPAAVEKIFLPSEVPLTRLVFALIVYQPIAMIFGTIGGIRAWIERDNLGKFFGIWLVSALFLAILPLGRQVTDLAWVLVPFWVLAARMLARELTLEKETIYASAGLAGLITILLANIWLGVASVARLGLGASAWSFSIEFFLGVLILGVSTVLLVLGWSWVTSHRWSIFVYIGLNLVIFTQLSDTTQSRPVLILGTLFFAVVSTVSVVFGWSWPVARRGLVWGLVIGIGIYSLSVSMRMVSPLASRLQELWYPQPATIEEGLLLSSLGDLSEWSTGRRETIDVDVTIDLASLRWALRNYPASKFDNRPDPISMPTALITSTDDEPLQAAAYRGADFLWHSELAWFGAFPPDLIRWIVYRDSPTIDEQVILWGRNDIFPGEEPGQDQESSLSPASLASQ